MTIKELIDQGVKKLQRISNTTARLDSSLLLAHLLHVTKEYLITHHSEIVSRETEKNYYLLIERRAEGEPLAYITGEKEFFGLPLFVTPDVLIPRPETEQLVEEGIAISKKLPLDDTVFIDVGTGSGAIAVSLAYSVPRSKVIALDVSEQALEIVESNIRRYRLTNVTSLWSDLLERLPDMQKQHVVLFANLPYVKEDEMMLLDRQVKNFEPHLALCGGKDGLVFYKKLFSQAVLKLRGKEVSIIFECDPSQIKKIKEMIRFAFHEPTIRIFKDLSGKERGGVARCSIGRE